MNIEMPPPDGEKNLNDLLITNMVDDSKSVFESGGKTIVQITDKFGTSEGRDETQVRQYEIPNTSERRTGNEVFILKGGAYTDLITFLNTLNLSKDDLGKLSTVMNDALSKFPNIGRTIDINKFISGNGLSIFKEIISILSSKVSELTYNELKNKVNVSANTGSITTDIFPTSSIPLSDIINKGTTIKTLVDSGVRTSPTSGTVSSTGTGYLKSGTLSQPTTSDLNKLVKVEFNNQAPKKYPLSGTGVELDTLSGRIDGLRNLADEVLQKENGASFIEILLYEALPRLAFGLIQNAVNSLKSVESSINKAASRGTVGGLVEAARQGFLAYKGLSRTATDIQYYSIVELGKLLINAVGLPFMLSRGRTIKAKVGGDFGGFLPIFKLVGAVPYADFGPLTIQKYLSEFNSSRVTAEGIPTISSFPRIPDGPTAEEVPFAKRLTLKLNSAVESFLNGIVPAGVNIKGSNLSIPFNVKKIEVTNSVIPNLGDLRTYKGTKKDFERRVSFGDPVSIGKITPGLQSSQLDQFEQQVIDGKNNSTEYSINDLDNKFVSDQLLNDESVENQISRSRLEAQRNLGSTVGDNIDLVDYYNNKFEINLNGNVTRGSGGGNRAIRDEKIGNSLYQIGYVYVWVNDSRGLSPAKIPFQFNPEISESGVAARYNAFTTLSRIGSVHSFLGTDNMTLTLTTNYFATAKDDAAGTGDDPHGLTTGFTMKNIQLIELAYRSLVYPTYTPDTNNAEGYRYFKPPMLKVVIGDLSQSSTGSSGPFHNLISYPSNLITSENIRSDQGDKRRYKNFVASNVAITKNLNEIPLYIVNNIIYDTMGFSISLTLTEINPAYADVYPNFMEYYNVISSALS